MLNDTPASTLTGGWLVMTSWVAPAVTLNGTVVAEVRPLATAWIVTPPAASWRVSPGKIATPW